MKFAVSQKDFHQAASLAALGAFRTSEDTILKGALIIAKDNRVSIQCTNQQLRVIAKCDAAVPEPGRVLVSADDLRSTLSGMMGIVEVSGDLLLKSENARMELLTLRGEFPLAEKPDGETEIPGGVEAFLKCAPFASKDDRRTNIHGVLFESETAMATTGNMFLAVPCFGGSGQIIPLAAQAVIKRIGGRLFLSDRTWRVENEGVTAVGSLVSDKPIDWRRVAIPRDPKLILGAAELLTTVQAATVGRGEWAVLSSEDGILRVSGDRFKGNHLHGEVTTTCDGHLPDFVAGTGVLTSCLSAFGDADVRMSYKGPLIRIDGPNGEFALFGTVRDARNALEAA